MSNDVSILSAKQLLGMLPHYATACRALEKACSVDEVKKIRDEAIAMAVLAHQAKNRDAEANAVELRMRATRKLDQLRQAQKDTLGLNRGAAGGGKKTGPRGSLVNPRDQRPTLASQGIDKNLAQQARVLGAMSDERFEKAIAEARDATTRVMRRVINAAATEQERAGYRARIEQGGKVEDLVALAASGFRAGAMVADPGWEFRTYSEKGKQRSPERHYDCMSLDEIKALPVASLAADDCVLLLCTVWPELPGALEVIQAWGFTYSTLGFLWVKTTPNAKHITLDGAGLLTEVKGSGLHTGMGYKTRSNCEPVLLATKGAPVRLANNVHQIIVAPVGAHSVKPEELYRRIEKLYPGPYLELFARQPRAGWRTWGNELAPDE